MAHIRICLLIVAVGLIANGASAGTYTITRIGSFGGTDTRATDINNHGQVVGYSNLPGDLFGKAFVWDGGTMTPLDGLAQHASTSAYGINDNGEVVGHGIDGTTYETTALLWSGGRVTDLGADLRASRSTAWDINDRGMVVGQAAVGTTFCKGFIWDGPGRGQIVGTLAGRVGGANLAVNNAGLAVGHSFFYLTPDQAHLVTPGPDGYRSELISAPYPAVGFADDINGRNVIVGRANRGAGPHLAVLFTPGGEEPFIDLGVLPGARDSGASGVNEAGVIVGSSGDNPDWPTGHAFVYADGRMQDLNDLFVDPRHEWDVLIEAQAINDGGDIVGYGWTSDGNISAFLLRELEQATIAMDIKPGSDLNAVNPFSDGLLPVGILGSDLLDVNDIDPASLMLEGVFAEVKGGSGNIGSFEDVNEDGLMDLLVHFSVADLPFGPDTTEAELTGLLLDGMAIVGTDAIRIAGGRHFGADGEAAQALPEPATLALLAVGALLAGRRRR